MATKCRIKHNTYGGIWFKEMTFLKAGDFKNPHTHNFDHVTFITAGSVKVYEIPVDSDGDFNLSDKVEIGVFSASSHIKVPKNMVHYVEAMEDNSIAYCVEALHDGMDTSEL